MNERIRELEARAKHRSQYLLSVLCNKTNRKSTEITEQEKQEIFSQTFAELIVLECIEQASISNGHGNNQWDKALTFAADNIKKHFGVE